MSISTDLMIERFVNIYGGDRSEVEVFFAPGQVSLIGDHTDYNGGHVLPCAISLGTYAAIRKRDDKECRISSAAFPLDGVYTFSAENVKPEALGRWVNYPLGAIWSLAAHGYPMPQGFDIYYDGDLSMNSGLSSSASIIVVTLYALKELFGFSAIEPIDLALMGKDAENGFLEIGSGILAPFMSVFGKKDHAIFLSSASMHYKYTPLKLGDARIVIANSGIKHANMQELLGKCQADCREGMRYLLDNILIRRLCDVTSDQYETYKDLIPFPDIRKRVKHVVYENQRAFQAYNCLMVGNLTRFGKLMNESHISLRDDFCASCPEVDTLVEAAWNTPGVLGARMTGVGFGGCSVNIVEGDAVENFIASVGKTYTEKTGRTASFFVADVGDGAHRA